MTGRHQLELQPLVEATEVVLTVKGRTILDHVDLRVEAGERLALTGPSGSGKTSLLTVIAGMATPDSGSVHLHGVPVSGPSPEIGMVLQSYGLLPLLTPAENIEASLRASGHQPKRAIAIAAEVLAGLGLTDHADRVVEKMSGGQQQRVAVARGLALDPTVLLADEPTAEQDAANRALIIDALLRRDHTGGAVVIATHDPEITELCDRTVALRDGHVV